MTALKERRLRKQIAPDGYVILCQSRSRPGYYYSVYTGDQFNSPHCTCEGFRQGKRDPGALFTCWHIRKVLYGED